MKPGARLSAAIEVVDHIIGRHQPVAVALSDWGKAHRFAGSGDRDAIGRLVYDAIRRKASSAFVMGDDSPRGILLGSLRLEGHDVDAISALCSGSDHAPAPLTDDEGKRLTSADLGTAPDWVKGDYPEWLDGAFAETFASRKVAELGGFTERAPADLRVNTLKATPERVLKSLVGFDAQPAPHLPNAIRIAAPTGPKRTPNLQAEAAFQAGWFEIQDVGSQIAAALAAAGPRLQVLDFCAGAGGKTLAIAAAMQNSGQIYAYDSDRERLKAIHARLKRAGVRNVQVLRAGDRTALDALGNRFDVVFVDAPCSGSGTWRRRPDSKWRLREHAFAERQKEQDAVLSDAARFVKPGGRLVYVTCSILRAENNARVEAFIASNAEFRVVPFADAWRQAIDANPPASADGGHDGLLLTPHSHGTDGFFVTVMTRTST